MADCVCRAITFKNYHIPLTKMDRIEEQYSTIGFFDGMSTERLDFHYDKEDLKALWRYSVHNTLESQGKYSYQNTFCLGRDDWNKVNDRFFWNEDTDSDYPLLFVVFLQLDNYMKEKEDIENQCRQFNHKLEEILEKIGVFYSYITLDKNDFVVCIKTRNYKKAVEGIKNLHKTARSVIYSYTIFSVSGRVLNSIKDEKYNDLYGEIIDSISLKGIANSYNLIDGLTLDQKYLEFCELLVNELREGTEELDYKVYDILGDNDFRLIIRNISLGRLLEQYADEGHLSYRNANNNFRFYLYSSSMLLNTKIEGLERIDNALIDKSIKKMEDEFVSRRCDTLSKEMGFIEDRIKNIVNSGANEKEVTFCHALWQLLQSLKALEIAPTKQYDFYSLYHPYSAFVRILKDKLDSNKDIGEQDHIYEFAHKISNTLHGTLRTDIQFFQIRDFNAVVHYAPAKLRAFYSIWALEMSDYYNNFGGKGIGKYSFIVSPEIARGTGVRQLFTEYSEREKLMLITLPERHLYSPRWLSIVLSHEVSHFVGHNIRNREIRHDAWLRISARFVSLELNHYMYRCTDDAWKNHINTMISKASFFQDTLQSILTVQEKSVRQGQEDTEHVFHSRNSIAILRASWQQVISNRTDEIVSGYREFLSQYLHKQLIRGIHTKMEKVQYKKDICIFCDVQKKTWESYFERTVHEGLPSVLGIVRYICSETFADLMAVLTLNLSLVDYVASIVESEYAVYDDKESQNASLLVVRIGLVGAVVYKLVTDNKDWLIQQGKEFVGHWSGKIWQNARKKFAKESMEYILLSFSYGYQKDIKNYDNVISGYESLYVPEKGGFVNHTKGFLCDKYVWDEMFDYLYKCGTYYINELKNEKDGKLVEKKKNFVDYYSILAGKDTMQVVHMIEAFLSDYEMQMKIE